MSTIYQISQILAAHGVEQAVLSPGSRVAPLAIAFARNPKIKAFTHSDERAAAYMALGIAQQSQKPVALACTSGTAAVNYAPAVAEAFYQQVPLLIFTADRPPEWIDQQDGQAIRQQGIYGQHIKGGYQFPVDLQHQEAQWHAYRILNEACLLAQSYPQGPVHINVPIREPFYPEPEEVKFEEGLPKWQETKSTPVLSAREWTELSEALPTSGRVLVVAGQGQQACGFPYNLPICNDIISNQHSHEGAIIHHDLWLGQLNEEQKVALRPDLLITFGQSLISKNLKLFLRKYSPQQHWHIQESGMPADTFQCLSRVIRLSPKEFWEKSAGQLPWKSLGEGYLRQWSEFDQQVARWQATPMPSEWIELKAVQEALGRLKKGWQLHLANSLSVRYANFFNLKPAQKGVTVWGNRGTSGIDGSNSTFMGQALASPNSQHLLITGDVAFLYDRNAFWHNYPTANCKVLLLNNQGGSIFRMINGPKKQPELEEYFVTQQAQTGQSVAVQAGWEYRSTQQGEALTETLGWLMNPNSEGKLLEVFSNGKQTEMAFNDFKAEARGLLNCKP